MRKIDPRGAHVARTAALHAKLAPLQQLADNHFGHGPEAVHWGHVGDLGRAETALHDLHAVFDGQLMECAMDTLPKLSPTHGLLQRVARAAPIGG